LEQRDKIEKALSDVISFEEALGNITDKPVDSSNLVPYKIANLSSEFPFIDWTQFFDMAFKDNEASSIPTLETEVLVQVGVVIIWPKVHHAEGVFDPNPMNQQMVTFFWIPQRM
jgi:hypothetical protein